MKLFCVVTLAFVVACAAEGSYTSDAGLNIDALVKDVSEVQKILNCFTKNVECSAQAAALRDDLPDALGGACSKCTPQQKHNTKIFFEAVQTHFSVEYEGLQKKFDPDNKLFPALLTAVASY